MTSDAKSYGTILRSTSIVGGAQVVTLLIGLIRTKAIAVLIGPAGIGLVGIYLSITAMANTLAGMGLQTSGVRDIAKHYGEDNPTAVARTAETLQRTCWITGCVGSIALAVGSPWIARLSFGTSEHTTPIAVLAIVVCLNNLTSGNLAVLRGTRQIGNIAWIQINGAAIGTLASLPLYFWLRKDGIVPALVSISAISFLVSWHYKRKTVLPKHFQPWRDTLRDANILLRFGTSMVIAGMASTGAVYAIRSVISNEFDLQAVGTYAAAYSVSGMFVQFILQAMGTDFYPNLTTVAHDRAAMSRLINEQTEIGLLLSFPGILATLVAAPLIIATLYSVEFAAAAIMLQWFVLGCIGKILSWPLGYSLLAKGHSKLYAATELLLNGAHVGFVFIFCKQSQLTGSAVAFATLYFLCTILFLLITRVLFDFKWSNGVWTELSWMTIATVTILGLELFCPSPLTKASEVLIVAFSTILCFKRLAKRVGPHHRIVKLARRLPASKFLLP